MNWHFVPNGVNGVTGEYLVPELSAGDIAGTAKSSRSIDFINEMQVLSGRLAEDVLGLRIDLDPLNVADVGWCVVFSTDEPPETISALQPLLDHRASAVPEGRFRVLDYYPNEPWRDWLQRHQTSPGNPDPNKVPYYVLLVGSAERIPFSFQYLLGTEYAVGRVAFDTPAQYESWVSKAIGGARETAPRRRALTVFGTRHPNDPATQLSSEHLLRPLVAGFEPNGTFGKLIEDLVVHQMLGADATKAKLADVLRGTSEVSQPAILFSATHGVGGFPPGDPQQTMCQGALLCQDWLGAGQIGPGSYFAASDLGVDAQVDGMVMFMFACYSAGTPLYDSYLGRVPEAPSRISVAPFVAKLPQALLEAGAVGVVGHVDRAWGYSFVSGDVESILPFQNAIGRILRGEPVGHAVKEFHDRYAVLSASLAATLDNVRFGEVVSDRVIAALSTERADAQNYLLLGDPAAVVAMAGVSGPGESPAG